MWTSAHGQILTLNNLMLRGRPLANRCYLCCCNEESMDHLLIFCLVAHSLWMSMLQLFGIVQVMLGLVADLLFCWYHWIGKYKFDIRNLVPGCLMWTIWTERNRCSFEDNGKSLAQLLVLCQRTFFDWSWCWGFSNCSALMDFLLSLRIAQCLFTSVCFFLLSALSLFTIVNLVYFSCYYIFNNIFSYLSKKSPHLSIYLYQGS